jgi:rhodanese-related sulfurtransferase
MSRSLTTSLVAAALAVLAGPAAAKEEGFQLMPMDQVERILGQPGVAVYDANVPELWAQHHLPGATHIVGRQLAGLLPADHAARVIFYCTNPK